MASILRYNRTSMCLRRSCLGHQGTEMETGRCFPMTPSGKEWKSTLQSPLTQKFRTKARMGAETQENETQVHRGSSCSFPGKWHQLMPQFGQIAITHKIKILHFSQISYSFLKKSHPSTKSNKSKTGNCHVTDMGWPIVWYSSLKKGESLFQFWKAEYVITAEMMWATEMLSHSECLLIPRKTRTQLPASR